MSTHSPTRRRLSTVAGALAVATATVLGSAAPSAAIAAEPDPLTVAYVEVNSNDLSLVGDYELADGANAFDVAVIFAANINTDANGNAVLYLNPRVQATLDDAANQIRPLQADGIKVTLSLLGNHQSSGFANFPTQAAAQNFANQVAQVVNEYGLDGVDIDDEWVTYGQNGTPASNANSAAWFVDALDATLPADSLITLYDIGETARTLQNASASTIDKLDYVWNPYYGSYNPPAFATLPDSRLGAAAVDLTQTSSQTAASLATRTINDGYGVFVTYNLTPGDHSTYISSFTNPLNGQATVYTG